MLRELRFVRNGRYQGVFPQHTKASFPQHTKASFPQHTRGRWPWLYAYAAYAVVAPDEPVDLT
jgi:hypothetical protein